MTITRSTALYDIKENIKKHKQRILLKIIVKIWKSLANFFNFDYKIFSAIGTVHQKMRIFWAVFLLHGLVSWGCGVMGGCASPQGICACQIPHTSQAYLTVWNYQCAPV